MKTTGLSRVSKDLIIKEVEKELKAHPIFFVTQHSTISGTSMDKLRAKLRQSKARYIVVKNSLGQKAFEKANMKEIAGNFTGACGITFTSGDPVAPCKVLVDFAKENEAFKIQTGYLNGQIVSVDQIKALASLPSREVLLARVAAGIQAPISGFVQVLAGTLRKMVTVLDAIAKKQGNS